MTLLYLKAPGGLVTSTSSIRLPYLTIEEYIIRISLYQYDVSLELFRLIVGPPVLFLGLLHKSALPLLLLQVQTHHRTTDLLDLLSLLHFLQLVAVFQIARLVDIAHFGVHLHEESEQTENVEQYEVLHLSVQSSISSPWILEVGRHVVGSDFEEKGWVCQQDQFVEDDSPLGPLHQEHHDAKIPHEEDDFHRESHHGDDLVPVSVVDDQEEANKAEGGSHLREEDVVEQDIEIEHFPALPAERVCGNDTDEDRDHHDGDGHVPLHHFVIGEHQRDVLEGDRETEDEVEEVEEQVLLRPGSNFLFLFLLFFRGVFDGEIVFVPIFQKLGNRRVLEVVAEMFRIHGEGAFQGSDFVVGT